MRQILFPLFFLAAGCGGSSGMAKQDERQMAGVFTVFTEGTQFQECPGREPWQCFDDGSPPCAMEPVGGARETIGVALGKAEQGYAAFKIELVGKRLEGGSFGHLGAYGCEVRKTRILSIAHAQSVPLGPETGKQ
jgi:hypothetical protein